MSSLLTLRRRYVIIGASILVVVAVFATAYLLWGARGAAGVAPLGEEERAWLAQRSTLRFAGRWDEPPYGFSEAEGTYRGYEVDLAESLGPILGVAIDVRAMTREEALSSLAKGEIDAVMGMVQSSENSSEYAFTEPYASSSLAIFVRSDRFDITRWEDLRGQQVAVQAGTAAQRLVEGESGISSLVVQTAQAGLTAVADGQVAAFVADEISGAFAAQDAGLAAGIKVVGLPRQAVSYSLAVPKDAVAELAVLNHGLAAVEALGVKQQIDRTWLGAPLAAGEPAAALSPGTVTALLVVVVAALFVGNAAFMLLRIRRRSEELRAPVQGRTLQEERVPSDTREAAFTASRDLSLLEVSPEVESLTGYPKDVLLTMRLSDLVAPVDRRALRAFGEKVLAEGWGSLDRIALVDPHGGEVPLSLRAQSSSQSGHKMIMGMLRDEREAERLSGLVELRTRYLSAARSIAATVNATGDTEEMLTQVLDKVLELTRLECGVVYLDTGVDGGRALTPVVKQGLTQEMMGELGWPDTPLQLAEEVAQAGRLLVRSRPSGPARSESSAEIRDGGTQAGVPLGSKDRIYGVMNLYGRGPRHLTDDDISVLTAVGTQVGLAIENSQLIQRLQRTVSEMGTMRRFSESVLQDMTNGLVVVDREGAVRLINRAGESLLGCREKEVLGSPVDRLLGRGARVVRESMDREMAYPSEEVLVRSDGGEGLPVGMSVSPWRGEGGRVNGAVVILRDLSREKELEEERVRLDRLALLGEWSAVMAHQIRNPLAGMSAGIQHLLGKFAEGDERHEALRRIQKEGERVSRTIDDILLISRPPRLNVTTCDLSEILSDVIRQSQEKAAAQHVDIMTEIPDDLPDLRADKMRLEQAFSNIIVNAIEAMPNGGLLRVSGSGLVPAAGPDGDTRPFLEVVIQDEGIGIKPEDLAKIFDPFWTTKAGGTGLGLPIAKRIVEEHQGELDIRSIEGQGTTVTVRLPLNMGRSR
jgi:two-component system nitrogen regulation sensor histidine kinase GlnL